MQEFIITTPEQLRTVISETVKDEFTRQFPAIAPVDLAQKPQDELLTRQQAAERLKISLPTLNELTKSGKLIGYRIGNRLRYKTNEVNSALTKIKTSNFVK